MKTITVKNLDGTNENVEIVYYFDIKELNRTFAIISKNEKLKEGMSKVYISEVNEETPGLFKFVAITDESVWDNVKAAMKSIIQGNKMDSSKNISGVVELLGSRVIGIKDTDKEKFASISLESSFTIETPSETPSVASATNTPETIVQTPAETAPVQEPTPVVSEVKEEVKPVEAEPALESTNIFDQIAAASQAEPVAPVTPEVPVMPVNSEPIVDVTSTETATPIPEPANEPVVDVTPEPVSEPIFDVPEVNNSVGEKLVTPQELYKQEETIEKQKDIVEMSFDRIRAELMKKDEIIAELQAKIKELESARNMNYQNPMPDQTLSYKQAA